MANPLRAAYQLYSSRNFGPLDDSLAMLKRLGFAGVEPFGAQISTPERAARLASTAQAQGLTIDSCHLGLDVIRADPDLAIRIAETLGVSIMVIPFLPERTRPSDAAGWAAFGRGLEAALAPLRAAGLTTAWHNHDFEFAPLSDGTTPLRHLLDGAPSLRVELDLGWVAHVGRDPLQWIEDLGERLAAVHLKDLDGAGPEPNWVPLGAGRLDTAAIIQVLRERPDVKIVLEHDDPADDVHFAETSMATFRSLT